MRCRYPAIPAASLWWPAKTSSPDLITGVVSLLELDGGFSSSVDGDFLGRGDPEISGEMLTTDPHFGDDAGTFLVSGSYGLNENCFDDDNDDVDVVGGDCEDDDDDARTTSETTIEGLFLFLLLSTLLLLLVLLDFYCNSLFPPTSAPIWEQVWARSCSGDFPDLS